jgi:4-hydroxy-tetrahydrodipicolinate reductase
MSKQSISIALCGYGKMGQSIEKIMPDFPKLRLLGIKVKSLKDQNASQCFFYETSTFFEKADIIVDFSTPKAANEHLAAALLYKKPLLIGTTGLDEKTFQSLQEASKHIPVLIAANTSLGICVMSDFVKKAATLFGEEFDIEIHEVHHKHKKDAPSGTALMLGKAAAKGRNIDFEQAKIYPHDKERVKGNIGFSVSRGGSVVGVHSISFIGEDEIFTLSHKGLTRSLFARGALRLTELLVEKQPGFYSINDLYHL